MWLQSCVSVAMQDSTLTRQESECCCQCARSPVVLCPGGHVEKPLASADDSELFPFSLSRVWILNYTCLQHFFFIRLWKYYQDENKYKWVYEAAGLTTLTLSATTSASHWSYLCFTFRFNKNFPLTKAHFFFFTHSTLKGLLASPSQVNLFFGPNPIQAVTRRTIDVRVSFETHSCTKMLEEIKSISGCVESFVAPRCK